MSMIIDPEDIDFCEKHSRNYVAGDVCSDCEDEEHHRDGKLFGLAKAVINDGSASASLKSYARKLIAI